MNETQDKKTVRHYNKELKLTKVGIRFKKNKTQAVLTTDKGEITHKLNHSVNEVVFNKDLNMSITETVEKPVTKENFKEVLPSIFLKLSEALKKEKELNLVISYSSMTIVYEDAIGEYDFLDKGDVSTLYCKEIDGKDETKINSQIMRRDKAEKTQTL